MLTRSGEQVSTSVGHNERMTVTRRAGDQLRGELLQAASELAAGPRPVAIPSLRAVARAVGVSASAVYRHFPSQSALTRALLENEYAGLEAAVLDGDDPARDVRWRLRRLAREYVRWGLANPGMYQLLFESSDQLDADSALPGATDRVMELASVLLGEAQDAMDAAVLAEQLWFWLHGIVSIRIHKPDHQWRTDAEAVAESIVDRI